MRGPTEFLNNGVSVRVLIHKASERRNGDYASESGLYDSLRGLSGSITLILLLE